MELSASKYRPGSIRLLLAKTVLIIIVLRA
jgi:hypothetical protein